MEATLPVDITTSLDALGEEEMLEGLGRYLGRRFGLDWGERQIQLTLSDGNPRRWDFHLGPVRPTEVGYLARGERPPRLGNRG